MTPDTVEPNPNLNPDADPTRPAPPDLRAVERNLQRERRVFSMVVLLLGLLVVAIASTAVLVRFNGSLRAQEQMTRLYEQGVVDAVLERRSTLAASNLILELRANGTLPVATGGRTGLCAKVDASVPSDDVLQQSCDQSVRALLAASQRPSIEMISICLLYTSPSPRDA